MHFEADTLLPEAHWSNKTLLDVALLMCKILVEVWFDLKSIQVLSYWSLALLIIGEGNTLPLFPATIIILFVQSENEYVRFLFIPYCI